MELCAKRKGTDFTLNRRTCHVHQQQSMTVNELGKSNNNSEIGLAEKRAELDKKLKSTFESIFEKYGKDFNGIGDEIDIATGRIVVDNGHLLCMQSKGKDDVWNYTRNQQTKVDDEALENSAFPSEISSIICDEDDEEQDLRGNPVINEEDASESECDCDCYEDDLILRGFVRANRFLKLPSKDISNTRLHTFQRESTLDSLSSNTENISGLNKFTYKESFHTEPKFLDQAHNHTVHEDEIELAWRLPKLPPSQQDINRKTNKRTETEKLFTLRANLSFNSKSVEYWGLERQARQFKLEGQNNYSPGNANEIMGKNISSYVSAIPQDSIYNWKAKPFMGEENSPNMAAKEILSSSIDAEDSKEPMIKYWNTACEQEEILQNTEFANITKYEAFQTTDFTIQKQKISGSKTDSLLKSKDLIFGDFKHSSNTLPTPDSVSDDTLEPNVSICGSNSHKIHENGILGSSSINKNLPRKKFIETVKKCERPSSDIINNQAIAMEESSRSPSIKSITSTEKYEARNSRSLIQVKENISDNSFGKPAMVPKQKFNHSSNSIKDNQVDSENFSILKPIFNKKSNILPPAHLHTKKLSLISTPIKINASANSSSSKHITLVPKTPNQQFNLGTKTTISKTLWRKALRNSLKWSPKTEELDELSLDQTSQSQNSIFKMCDKTEILGKSPKVLSTVKKINKRLFSKLEDENDDDELSIDFKNSPSKRKII
ncbi:putative myb-like dna-binding domain protein [Erysiphe neolycopersici]|uniref:Putative myb-like dna-binding domain protein n=1 Tax=Erysiphe neolycopersici TaxID=212602 RepID=A0A420HWG2_9PEZI|nr:putative myb-like dna-binding domain protein [Erysiphe neolycopersici]